MLDLSTLTEHFVYIVAVACLIIGYIIKHASFLKWIPNTDIPVILACLGAILNAVVTGFSIENVIWGALTGLASTGMHQAFTQIIEGAKSNNTDE